jgi:hypothetical protein
MTPSKVDAHERPDRRFVIDEQDPDHRSSASRRRPKVRAYRVRTPGFHDPWRQRSPSLLIGAQAGTSGTKAFRDPRPPYLATGSDGSVVQLRCVQGFRSPGAGARLETAETCDLRRQSRQR